jgi:predicted PurR-regulated permease PerM
MSFFSGGTRQFRLNALFVFALCLAVYVAWLARDVLLLLYVSALFAVALRPIVRFTGRLRFGKTRPFRSSAIVLLLFLVAAALTAFCFLAFPPVIHDLQAFGGEMPKRLPELLDKLKRVPFAQNLNTQEIAGRMQDLASTAATHLLLSIKDWAGALFQVIMGLILTIYFMIEGRKAYNWFLSFFPLAQRERLDATLQRAEVRMGRWLVGQGSLMLILGVISTAVYLALHIRYAYALGVLTGLLNLIPMLGAAVCIVLALLVAAIDSWGRVLGVAVFYLLYIQLENSYLTPRIMRNSVDLPGLAIIIALLLGFSLEGIPGAMVSVPTAVLVSVLLDEYLVQKDPA